MTKKTIARRLRLWLVGLTAALFATTVLPLFLEDTATASAHDSVLAIVQAESVEVAAAAVRAAGAEVIEELDGVQAVGARLTNDQRLALSTHKDITQIWVNQ